MAKLNEIRFFLLVSLMIFPSWALNVTLATYNRDYYHHYEIITRTENGVKTYVDVKPRQNLYLTRRPTLKVILYIVSPERFTKIMNKDYDDDRQDISEEITKQDLSDVKYELLYLAIEDFKIGEDEPVIRDFIRTTILICPASGPQREDFETIGDINLEAAIPGPESSTVTEFKKYKENAVVFKKKLRRQLKAIGKKKANSVHSTQI